MTAQNRTTNKGRFEQGDTPQGSDYVDLIDSYLSLADTTAQAVSSPLTLSGSLGVAATASASTLEVLGIIRVSGKATFSGAVEVSGMVSAGSMKVGAVSADSLWVGGEQITPPSGAVAAGETFITASAAFVASAAGSYSIIPGTFSAISTLQQDTSSSPTLCEIEYTGSSTAKFVAQGVISVKASATNKLSSMRIAVNASSLSRTEIDRFIASTTDAGAGAVQGLLLLNPNDKVSFMLTNKTDTAGLHILKVNFNLRELV